MSTASDFARDKLQYLRSTFSSSLQAGNNQFTIGWRQLEKQHYQTFCFGCRVLNAQCLVLQMVLCLHYITLIGEKIVFHSFFYIKSLIFTFVCILNTPLQYCLIQVKAFPCSATLELCVNRYTGISMVPIWQHVPIHVHFLFWCFDVICSFFWECSLLVLVVDVQ